MNSIGNVVCACSEVKIENVFKRHRAVWCTCSSEAKGLPSSPTLESLGEITGAASGRDGIYLDQAQ